MSRAHKPAFPVADKSQLPPQTINPTGLTVMEEFTKAAMQGIAANCDYTGANEERLAAMAVTLARETLAALAKERT